MSQANVEQHYRAAVRRWWDTLLDIYPDFTSEIEEVRDLGDVTIAQHAFRGEGMESGAQMEQRQWQVTRWRDNKAVWWKSCPTEAEARSRTLEKG